MAIVTARDAAALFAPLFADAKAERLAVLHLDGERRMIVIECHDVAEADEIVLPMRAIFAAALGHGAVGMIVAHNHPSGDPQPSRADKAATRRLFASAEALGIALHDHLIFAGGEWRSLRQLGLL